MNNGVRCSWHLWGKDHRCKSCGRWQPGFAPKKEFQKPRDECQVCENTQALESDGLMCHHGYQRPGLGFIVGDCYGVDHRPFPATDALETWLGVVDRELGLATKERDGLPTVATITVMVRDKKDRTKKVPLTLQRGEQRNPWDWPQSFDVAVQNRERELADRIRRLKTEQKRVKARIEKGQALQHE